MGGCQACERPWRGSSHSQWRRRRRRRRRLGLLRPCWRHRAAGGGGTGIRAHLGEEVVALESELIIGMIMRIEVDEEEGRMAEKG